MSNPIVLFPFTQHESINQFLQNAQRLSLDYPVIFAPCETDSAYDYGVKALWGFPGDLIIVEHDIHAKSEDVKDLLDCPYPLCARAYQLNHQTYENVIVHRKFYPDRPDWAQWLHENDEWADYVGFGLTKIGRMFRSAYRPNWMSHLPDQWQEQKQALSLDSRFSLWTHSLMYKWHIHWPIVPHGKDLNV